MLPFPFHTSLLHIRVSRKHIVAMLATFSTFENFAQPFLLLHGVVFVKMPTTASPICRRFWSSSQQGVPRPLIFLILEVFVPNHAEQPSLVIRYLYHDFQSSIVSGTLYQAFLQQQLIESIHSSQHELLQTTCSLFFPCASQDSVQPI